MKTQADYFDSKDPSFYWDMLRSGDRVGLEGLYRFFSEDLFRYGCSRGYEIDFVQDAIQDVFIDLWKYHGSLKKAENIKVYLFKSLAHKMYRVGNRQKRIVTEGLEAVLEEKFFVESIETRIIDRLTDESLKRKLANSIETLPDRQKEVILYLFFEKLTYEEVSSLMGINLSSVYTMAWKAIGNLKKVVFLLCISAIQVSFL